VTNLFRRIAVGPAALLLCASTVALAAAPATSTTPHARVVVHSRRHAVPTHAARVIHHTTTAPHKSSSAKSAATADPNSAPEPREDDLSSSADRPIASPPDSSETALTEAANSPEAGDDEDAMIARSSAAIASHYVKDDVATAGPTTLRSALTEFFFGAPLRGSHESLVRQNQRATQDGLTRIEDDDDLIRQRNNHTLVPLPAVRGLQIDDRLPANRRYTRPWTARFLSDLAAAHYAAFGSPIQVNSAVRTVDFQRHLLRTNGNAAPIDGDTASPHLLGATVDLAKKGMPSREVYWMRGYLLNLQKQGKLDVEEEFHQACFHLTVYRSYATPDSRMVAGAKNSLAAAIP
jgi:hypothetical protein